MLLELRTMAIVFLLVIAEQATAVSIDDAIVMDCALLIVTKLAKDLVTQVGFVHLSEASQAVVVHQKEKKNWTF
ncbi:hypothetical protein HID58_030245 [Brassica napus]|uniref:Uncharacterized protein n=1 Tax=Brassica napus TaxID=3708 RepID=A0ABQ8CFE5_BRANA|nr:hypothetical protein HID58_030245 [Brassica napus]